MHTSTLPHKTSPISATVMPTFHRSRDGSRGWYVSDIGKEDMGIDDIEHTPYLYVQRPRSVRCLALTQRISLRT